MSQVNANIRKTAKAVGVPFWRIAVALGISEPTMTRWIRFPLSEEREAEILSIIEALSKEDVQ